MANTFFYKLNIGDSVLVSYNGCQYPAKILDHRPMSVLMSSKEKREDEYFVHYIRWNKKWDEWVPVSRITKDTSQLKSSKVPSSNQISEKTLKIAQLPPVIEIPKAAKRKRTGLTDKENSDNETALSSSVVYARVSNVDAQAALKLLELSEPKRILTKLSKNELEESYLRRFEASGKVPVLAKFGNASMKKDYYLGTRPVAVPRKKRVVDKQIFTASSSVHSQDENFSQEKNFSRSNNSFSCSASDQENSVTTVQKNSDNIMRVYIN